MSLQINNLHATLENGIEILKGVSLEIPAGEIHAIMGPNGSGKSTLSKVIAGHESYVPTAGSILLDGVDISEMSIDERSRAGIFSRSNILMKFRASPTRTSSAPRFKPVYQKARKSMRSRITNPSTRKWIC